jgi:hypothetical protein
MHATFSASKFILFEIYTVQNLYDEKIIRVEVYTYKSTAKNWLRMSTHAQASCGEYLPPVFCCSGSRSRTPSIGGGCTAAFFVDLSEVPVNTTNIRYYRY